MVERRYEDPVEGPVPDEHPGIEKDERQDGTILPERDEENKPASEVEEEERWQAERRQAEPRDPSDDETLNPDPPPPEDEDWAERTRRDVTSKPDEEV
jgi:hypothetical protein